MGYLIYMIHPDLSLGSVVPSASLIESYRERSMIDPKSPLFGEADLAMLRKGYNVRWGPSAGNGADSARR